MTSETILGLRFQPGPGCKRIGDAIKNVQDILSSLKQAERLAKDLDIDESIKSLIDDAQWSGSDLEDDFEYCRTLAEDIRNWGGDWKGLAKNLIKYHEPELLNMKE